MTFSRPFLFKFFLISTLVLAQQPAAFANICDLIMSDAGAVYQTGMYLRMKSGKNVLSLGNIFDSHRSLLKDASDHFGEVSEIVWAGEIKGSRGKIEAMNETAGILVDDKIDIPKSSSVQLMESLFLNDPRLRALSNADTQYITYDPNDKHLTAELSSISKWRHDLLEQAFGMQGLMYVVTEYNEPVESVNRIFLDGAIKLVQMLSVQDRYGFKPKNPEIIPPDFRDIVLELSVSGLPNDLAKIRKLYEIFEEFNRLNTGESADIRSIVISE